MKNKWLEDLQNEFHQKTVGAFQEKMNEMYEKIGVESPYMNNDNSDSQSLEDEYNAFENYTKKDPGGLIYILDVGGHNYDINKIIEKTNYFISIFGNEHYPHKMSPLEIKAILWEDSPESLKEYLAKYSAMIIFGLTSKVCEIALNCNY